MIVKHSNANIYLERDRNIKEMSDKYDRYVIGNVIRIKIEKDISVT